MNTEADNTNITTYQYDLQGSMIKEQSTDLCRQYLYNDFHQCIQTDVIRGREEEAERFVQQNFYDGEGLRFALIENGSNTGFITDGWNNVTEFDGNGRVRKRIIRGMGIAASEDIRESADTVNAFTSSYHYYHGNERMDVEYITDESGNVVNCYAYDAFGSIISSSETIPNRYTYNGEAYDKATEQYYLRKRYYNPKLSRFMQEDEYRGDGLNLYAFCANNPVMYVDPSGYSQVFPSDIYPPGTGVDIYVDPGRVSYDKAQEKRNAIGIVTGNFTAGVYQDGSIISADLTKITIPQDVAIEMKGNKYNNFNEFRTDFWKTMSQSPVVRNEFSSSDLWAMEQGYAPRVHNRELYSKVFGKKYNIDHVIEIQDGGYVFDLDNMSILAPKTHEEKTVKERRIRKCDS